MENFISDDWLAIATLAIQAGILKFAYSLYKNFIQIINNNYLSSFNVFAPRSRAVIPVRAISSIPYGSTRSKNALSFVL